MTDTPANPESIALAKMMMDVLVGAENFTATNAVISLLITLAKTQFSTDEDSIKWLNLVNKIVIRNIEEDSIVQVSTKTFCQ